jgi:mRNA-degrading endonuclease RelE of RelBE toxin-antitoxin system
LACLIDEQASSDFQRQKKELKKYRRLDQDLATAYEAIQEDFKTACHATPIPGYHGTVFKYRCANSDTNKGRSGGYRILAFYHESSNTICPFSIYTHDQYPGQPPKERMDRWLKELVTGTLKLPFPPWDPGKPA